MTLLMSLSLLACSEYDLKRGAELTEPPAEETTPDPHPKPDPGTDPEPQVSGPDIEVSPTSLDFGWVARECTSDPQTITVSNVGDETLVVDDITLGGSGSAYYGLVRPQLPLELEPGTSDTLSVDFSPISNNTLTAEITVTSNDPDEPQVGVDMEGIGADDSLYEELFYQDYFTAVDVLWVVDNSGSMSDVQTAIADNFESFIYAFTDLGLDYHMGVVTTDMFDTTQSGQLQGSPTYITRDTPGAEALFLEMVAQGDNGSGNERGLDAVEAALTEPLLSGANAGFLRGDDVALATIVVSDENDASSMSASSFTSWYTSLKSDASIVSLSAFCGDRGSGCYEWVDWSSGLVMATAGTKYIDVVDDTDGIWQSICSNDFSEALTYLSLGALGMKYSFPLAETPSSLADVLVEVDGVEPPYSSLDGWTYDTTDNALVFHGDAIPGPGASIYVQYPIIGECN